MVSPIKLTADELPPVPPPILEIDSVDTDSAYGDEISNYTASISSSAMNFPEMHGRTYHAFREGRYTLPNDDQENDRLDIHHALILRAMGGKLFFAPISSDPHRVIDIATGTGIWAIDFSDEFPAAQVLGNDLSPTQPNMIPPNLSFLVDDVEDDWGYENQPFDFIHGRFLAGAIRDWPRLVRQSFDCAKPSGWVEFQEWDTFMYSQDNSIPPDSAIAKFHAIAGGAREAQGYDMKPGRSIKEWMTQAGFQNITVRKILLPLGPWPKNRAAKEIGMFNLIQMQMAIEGICLGTLPHAPQPWTIDEINVFLAEIRKDFRNRNMHGQYDFYVVYGQKPE